MEGALGHPRTCPRAGCGGLVAPTATVPGIPDYWIRRSGTGDRWWFTFTPPVSPVESPGRAAYCCMGCGQTFRIVETGDSSEKGLA